MLYVISEMEDKSASLWGYTQGKLYNLTAAMAKTLTTKTKIIPYFSPSKNS